MSLNTPNVDGHEKAEGEGGVWVGLGAALLVILLSFCGAILYMRTWWPLDKPQDFGAAVAAVGALFSALAFAGVVATVLLQSRELKLQREELKATRAEFQDQNRTMRRDLFERGYFQLLVLHRALATDLRAMLPNESAPRHGLSAFRGVAERIEGALGGHPGPEELVPRLHATLQECCFANNADLSHYFSSTFGLLDEIDRAGLAPDEAKAYTALLRAQMTEGERCVLLAYGLTTNRLTRLLAAGLFTGVWIRPAVRALLDEFTGANDSEGIS